MPNEAGVIVRFQRAGPKPTLQEAAEHLRVPLSALSPAFGVQVEGGTGKYHVNLLQEQLLDPTRGEVFSNPGFSLQGPPRNQ